MNEIEGRMTHMMQMKTSVAVPSKPFKSDKNEGQSSNIYEMLNYLLTSNQLNEKNEKIFTELKDILSIESIFYDGPSVSSEVIDSDEDEY